MSSKRRQHLLGIVGVIVLIVSTYAVFALLRAVVAKVLSLNSSIAVPIIAASVTVFVSVVSVIIGKSYEAREQTRKSHREKQTPVYEELIAFISRVLMGSKTGNAPDEREMMKFFTESTQRMMIWGDDSVVSALVNWRKALVNPTPGEPMKVVFLYEDLILAIRRDLGHKNKNLKRGDILSLFVKDINAHIALP